MLLVHYADLKLDRAGEMRRVADFLEIRIPEELWSDLVEAASFAMMREQSEELLPGAVNIWDGGSRRFLHKGDNGRWQEVFAKADLALYDAKVKASFSPELAHWLEHGRLAAA